MNLPEEITSSASQPESHAEGAPATAAHDIPADISMILPAAGPSSLLDRTLHTLAAAADPAHVELIVLDNGGLAPQAAGRLERAHPQALFVETQPAEPFGCALNRCLALARGRYLALLPPGAAITSNALYELLLFLDTTPETGMAGLAAPPPLSLKRLPGLFALLARFTGVTTLLAPTKRQATSRHSITEVAWLPLFPTVLRREMLVETGLFHERFHAFYLDADLCRHARRLGWHLILYPLPGMPRLPTGAVLDPPPPGSPLRGPSPVQLLDALRYSIRRLLNARPQTSFTLPPEPDY